MKKSSARGREILLFPAAVACIIPRMNIPDRSVTQMELKRSTGERGTKKLIAYHGIVYDVTDCPKWRTDLHEQLHFPGQDLTGELPDAPHQEDVFSRPCVKIIGRLEPEARP
jgi:predicted heme/steroid binding protein